MSMHWCIKCNMEMRCDKNGVALDFGNGHTYPGNRYKCPGCESMIIRTSPRVYFDPEYNATDEYFPTPGALECDINHTKPEVFEPSSSNVESSS